jgi:sialate O-acetylesterase
VKTRLTTTLAALALLAAPGRAELRLPAVIDDHMVLQRDARVALWGWAEPGVTITVQPDWSDAAQATVAADGTWRTTLDTPAAGGPHEIIIRGDGERVLRDVLVGEVWICSGQSNMEWPLERTAHADKFLPHADQPQIRLFDVARTASATPQPDCTGRWARCTPETAARFSGVGYHFGLALQQELNIPIGLVGTNWGGTPAEAWTSRAGLEPLGDFNAAIQSLDETRDLDDAGIERLQAQRWDAWWHALEAADRAHGGDATARAKLTDPAWREATLPGRWEDADLPDYDGIAWYRRSFTLPPDADVDADDWRLTLGPIDDMDTTFINGLPVGQMDRPGQWRTPRDYAIDPGVLHPGDNEIAVRVVDTGGSGGFTGAAAQFSVHRRGAADTRVALAGPWKLRATTPLDQLPPRPRDVRAGPHTPTALFNGMIAPLLPYRVRGAIWYQGESNWRRPQQYRTLFPALIEDWRRQWDCGAFPFYFVQIAPFHIDDDTGQAAELREAQTLALRLPDTGMAVTMDIGDPRDIHPRNKRDVGRRLARWALHQTYGRTDIQPASPLYERMTIDGERAVLHFRHAAKLRGPTDGSALAHFTIAGEDRRFVPARAEIRGATVVVWSEDVAAPAAVRYCWGAGDEGTVFNEAGLPAPSFRTDDWPRTE